MKKCPYCAEGIRKEAIVCRYCGRYFEPHISSEDLVNCPYCAELIRGGAILCRYCRTRLPKITPADQAEPRQSSLEPVSSDDQSPEAISADQLIPRKFRRNSFTNVHKAPEENPAEQLKTRLTRFEPLPSDYQPPEQHLSEISSGFVSKFRIGDQWDDVVVAFPPRTPSAIKKTILELVPELCRSAWVNGGQTFEGAVNWIDAQFDKTRTFERIWVLRQVRPFFMEHTRKNLRQSYYIRLKSLLSSLLRTCKSFEDVSLHMEHASVEDGSAIDKSIRPFVELEATRILREAGISGEEYITPILQRPVFMQDLESIVQQIVAELIQRYKGTDPTGLHEGIISRQAFEDVIMHIVGDDTKFNDDAGMSLIRVMVGATPEIGRYQICPDEQLGESGFN